MCIHHSLFFKVDVRFLERELYLFERGSVRPNLSFPLSFRFLSLCSLSCKALLLLSTSLHSLGIGLGLLLFRGLDFFLDGSFLGIILGARFLDLLFNFLFDVWFFDNWLLHSRSSCSFRTSCSFGVSARVFACKSHLFFVNLFLAGFDVLLSSFNFWLERRDPLLDCCDPAWTRVRAQLLLFLLNAPFQRRNWLLLILYVVDAITFIRLSLSLRQAKRTAAEVPTLVPALVPVHAALEWVRYLREAQCITLTFLLAFEIRGSTHHCQQWHCEEVDFHKLSFF